MTEERSTLDWALSYAERGWRVIPIPPGKKYPEGFGRWQKQATTDTRTIRRWWGRSYRDHGIGIATGRESGLFVVDLDVADGKPGLASWQALVDAYGPADTYTVRTGTGGLHLYYLWPDDDTDIRNNQSGKLGPGVDVRGEGGFVVAPPTIHPNGRPYVVLTPTNQEQ